MSLAFFDDDDDTGVAFRFSTFDGGAGEDTFGSTAGAGDVTAYGGSSNDKLVYLGQGGSNCYGGSANDYLIGAGTGSPRPPLRRDR